MDGTRETEWASRPPRFFVSAILDTTETFFREIVAGAAHFAREVGDWQLTADVSGSGMATPSRRLDLRDGQVQGIIASLHDPRFAATVATLGLPVVEVGTSGRGQSAGIPLVDTDDERIASMAFTHLRMRGLEHFAYYGVAASMATLWSVQRGDAFAACVKAAGYQCARLDASARTAGTAAAGRRLRDWLLGLPQPVGIMACSDLHGRRVLTACRSLRLRVPHQVAVIGVDNDELECELAVPPLTSIEQSARQIGYEAARRLDALLRPRRSLGGTAHRVPLRMLIPPAGVVARASTDTPLVIDTVVARLLKAIRTEACKGLTVAKMVDLAKLPRWKLEKRFRDVVGHSIHEDIVQVRLAEARRLIRTTSLPMKIVAARSGFHSVPYMTTIFRRSYGTTPARLRRMEREHVRLGPEQEPDTPEEIRT